MKEWNSFDAEQFISEHLVAMVKLYADDIKAVIEEESADYAINNIDMLMFCKWTEDHIDDYNALAILNEKQEESEEENDKTTND